MNNYHTLHESSHSPSQKDLPSGLVALLALDVSLREGGVAHW